MAYKIEPLVVENVLFPNEKLLFAKKEILTNNSIHKISTKNNSIHKISTKNNSIHTISTIDSISTKNNSINTNSSSISTKSTINNKDEDEEKAFWENKVLTVEDYLRSIASEESKKLTKKTTQMIEELLDAKKKAKEAIMSIPVM
ncbi:10833_t:CDS:2 [Diversispora eburnea]|uniref:10833_t:CDS:1 n=1 Tax=Diversispora eburnea TaxID=1213867 RepID=A0A9N9AWJ6_9GLOM|nr:10833_t:CDS:2 [Diversispora eburnea]